MKSVTLRAYIPAQDSALGQFFRFGIVGTIGFIVDSAALTQFAIPILGLDRYSGRVVSFLIAATCTWALNRRFTFKPTVEHPFRQWMRFLAANGVGFVANYSAYAAAVTLVPLAKAHLVLGVAAGAIAGLVFNFTINKLWVFRTNPE
jgi:putative flippase GtrA